METLLLEMDVEILEIIHKKIILGMKENGFIYDKDIKVSKVKEHSSAFTIELLHEYLQDKEVMADIRKAVKSKFENAPKFNHTRAFIELDFKNQYNYLSKNH